MGQVASITFRPERAGLLERRRSLAVGAHQDRLAGDAARDVRLVQGADAQPASSCIAGVLWISLPDRKTVSAARAGGLDGPVPGPLHAPAKAGRTSAPGSPAWC